MANEKTKLLKWLNALNEPELDSIIKELNKDSVQIPSKIKAAIFAAMVTNAVPSAAFSSKTLELFQSLMKVNATLSEQDDFFYALYKKNPEAVSGEPMKKVIHDVHSLAKKPAHKRRQK